MYSKETICALSTPAGSGAIAVIRLSGPESFGIIEKIFESKPKGRKLSEQQPYTIHHGYIFTESKIIDEVLVSIFKSPQSYTGEDIIEISCHGSAYIQQAILHLLVNNGARLAKPGEFTMRAFMNKKMDLIQAEAVAELIASGSETAHQIAMKQMRGGFTKEISILRDQLLHFISLIELELDFSEEDVEFADRKQLKELLCKINQLINRLTASFKLGNVIKNGIPVAIVGEPNVGKSTLLNVLLNEERAIVSEVAGTTRDAIEDIVNLKGITFRFIDTAGIRDTTDKIETLGIKKAFEKISQASIVLLLVNATDSHENTNNTILSINNQLTDNQKLILVINKIDEVPGTAENYKDLTNFDPVKDYLVLISAKYHKNIDVLIETLLRSINLDKLSESDVVVSNVRHYEALTNANLAIIRVLDELQINTSGDLLAQDIREALYYLGEITGEITTDEVLGNIFKNFCIGK